VRCLQEHWVTVPLNDLTRRPFPLGALLEVCESGSYIHGDEHDAFEREFAAYLGVKHVVGCANGTDALELALRALGISRGEKVATAANAGGYATTAIELIGAVPAYVDVEQETLTIDQAQVPDCAAVIATHLYGNVAATSLLHGSVPLIVDCAQAAGAVGACEGADIACFSFYPTKNLGAVGDGGALATNSDETADALRQLRQYGWGKRYEVERSGGRNSRLDEIQAAVLRDRLPLLDRDNETRRGIVRRYANAIDESAGRLVWRDNPSYVGHLAVVLCTERADLRARMDAANVMTSIHYPYPDHRKQRVSLPLTEYACDHVLTLPCFPEMTDREIDTVCEALS
jgi:dTDP-4-amino-4,6-dideoxygalactose transaminase